MGVMDNNRALSRHVERVSRPRSQLESGTKMMMMLGLGRLSPRRATCACMTSFSDRII
jgi:hypothetical protein